MPRDDARSTKEATTDHIFETFQEGWDYEGRLRATLKHFGEWRRRKG